MPLEETFNPSRAAKQVGIPASTLRLWSKVYSQFLSPGANPAAGEERRFTAADIEALRSVVQLRSNGLMPEEIIARLRNDPAALQQPPTTPLDVPQGENIHGTALQSSLDSPVSMATVLSDKLESVDRRLERVESQRSMILVAIAAFMAGVLLVVAATMLLSLLR